MQCGEKEDLTRVLIRIGDDQERRDTVDVKKKRIKSIQSIYHGFKWCQVIGDVSKNKHEDVEVHVQEHVEKNGTLMNKIQPRRVRHEGGQG